MRRAALRAAFALLFGIVHAGVTIGVAVRYGYDLDPGALAPSAVLWRYGGLVALGAIPAWLALSDRLATPLLILFAIGGYALFAELTPPDPTFVDVAEIEPAVDEPTGYTVVENGLYVVKYAGAWYVWLAGAALAGLWEHVVRARSSWLPAPGRVVGLSDRLVPDRAARIALAAGAVHALASVGYATGWGLPDGPLFVAWGVVGGVALLAVPTYLLVRHDLVWPTPLAIVLFLNSVHTQSYVAGPSDPHALYVAAWFVFLGFLLVVGGVEWGARKFLGSTGT